MTPHNTVQPALRDKRLFCFGYGYTAGFLAEKLKHFGWTFAGTTTDPEKRELMKQSGIDAELFDPKRTLGDPQKSFEGVTHVLISVPPGAEGDIVADMHGADISAIPTLEWVGYLSTTAVYGNQNGNWVDEATRAVPDSRRGSLRLRAEQQWQYFHTTDGLPLHTFRLSGIYGPGRSAIEAVRAGTARRIDKPGHVFNRIHVEDVAQTLIASMNMPNPGAIYNVADDLPSPSHEVISFACSLLSLPEPELLRFDQVEMAPIVRSFYKDNKRIRNDRIKQELNVSLAYPDYKAGLRACFAPEASAMDFLKFEKVDAPA